MKMIEAIDLIRIEWDEDYGALGKLRYGTYDRDCFKRLVSLLESIDDDQNELISKAFVSLVWYIPLFISWQIPRIKDDCIAKEMNIQSNHIGKILEKLLGIP